jgi:hypothetical protein
LARSAARRGAVLVCLLPFLLGAASSPGHAQNRKPTTKEIAAVRDCAETHEEDLDGVERKCPFNLVSTPCTEKLERQSNVGMADCYDLEASIWDDLLNENYKSLAAGLDDQQKAKLRDMQRAWIGLSRQYLRLLLHQEPRHHGRRDDGRLHCQGDGEASRAAEVLQRPVVGPPVTGASAFSSLRIG